MYNVRSVVENDLSLNDFPQNGISSKSLLNPKEVEQNVETIKFASPIEHAREGTISGIEATSSKDINKNGLKTLENQAICQ